MRRRELMLLLGGAMTAGRALGVQQKAIPVIGYLGVASPGPFAPFVAAFLQGLGEAGYYEGQNVAIEYRWAEGHSDRLPALAVDLVGRKVDVIAAVGGTAGIVAAKNATSTIPIVFVGRSRPAEAYPSVDKLGVRRRRLRDLGGPNRDSAQQAEARASTRAERGQNSA